MTVDQHRSSRVRFSLERTAKVILRRDDNIDRTGAIALEGRAPTADEMPIDAVAHVVACDDPVVPAILDRGGQEPVRRRIDAPKIVGARREMCEVARSP